MIETNRVAGGLKAAIHNPNVSEEAKDRARDRLEGLDTGEVNQPDKAISDAEAGNLTGNQLGGYKATLKSMFSYYESSYI